MNHAMHTWSRIARRPFVMTCSLSVIVLVGLVGLGQEASAAVFFSVNDRPLAIPAPAPVDVWDIEDQVPAQIANQRTVLSLSTPPASAPSSVLLFVPMAVGLLGVLLREQYAMASSGSKTESMVGQGPSGSSPCLLVLSPDPAVVHDVQELVHRAGYTTRITADVTETLAISEHASPALLLVDRRIPDWDMLRTSSPLRCVPLITLALSRSQCTEEQWMSDLERGADGTYDFHDGGRLFIAKMRAYLRRAGHDATNRTVYHVGAVRLDADRHEVTIAGQCLQLSAKPFVILKTLMQAPSRVFRRSELVDRVWGPQFAIGEHTLDVYVHALRRQLDRDPHRLCQLITIKGVGFKLIDG